MSNPFIDFSTPASSTTTAASAAGQPAAPKGGGIQWGNSTSTTGAGGAWGAPARSYEVDTTYVPPTEDTVVPAWSPPQAGGAWHNTPAAASASTFLLPASTTASDTVPAVPSTTAQLAFTDSTAVPVAKGTIGSGASRRDDGNFGFQPSSSTVDTRPLLSTSTPLPGLDPNAEDASKYAFYSLKRYRPYFNVDTAEVLWRVTSSFIGAFKPDFMQVTHTQPDLYGPFWVATTLVFVTAASGNFSRYIAWKAAQSEAQETAGTAPGQWFADTTELGTSAAMFYGYTFIVSLALWFWVRYLKADVRLVNMYCVYGYALTIFIPTSILCVVPVSAVRWVFVVVATLMSGSFLFMNMRDTVAEVALSQSIWLLGTVALLHAGLGVALVLLFFNYKVA